MKTLTIRALALGFGVSFLADAAPARAQVPVGLPTETITYETVSPAQKTVTYGEKVKVRRRFGKTVTVEKPKRFRTITPPVVQETRVIRPAPVAEQVIVQPAPVVEERWVQPPPVLERQVIQPAPVVETRLMPLDPVVRTRYLGVPPL